MMMMSRARTMPFQATAPRPMIAQQNIRRERGALAVTSSSIRPTDVDRRSALAAIVALPIVVAAPAALARDLQAAARAREERKAQLRAAAQDMKQTGKTEQVFEDSSYSVSEDKSPNIHTRQEEGARTSK